MKAVLVFVFLSLFSASLAARSVDDGINQCAKMFPAYESYIPPTPNVDARMFALCNLVVLGIYDNGKFDANGLPEEIKANLPPKVLSALLVIVDAVNTDESEDIGYKAYIIWDAFVDLGNNIH